MCKDVSEAQNEAYGCGNCTAIPMTQEAYIEKVLDGCKQLLLTEQEKEEPTELQKARQECLFLGRMLEVLDYHFQDGVFGHSESDLYEQYGRALVRAMETERELAAKE